MNKLNAHAFEYAAADGSGALELNYACLNYRVVSKNCSHADLGDYLTYGIEAGGSNCTVTLHDISTCGKTVELMAELFSLHQLSHIHLEDAVEDMLTL